MKKIASFGTAALAVALFAAGCDAQVGSDMVVSSDRALGELAASLLPDLADRAGMELRHPVRLELRSRQDLVAYLEGKLDQELPEAEAQLRVEAYALLGLVPRDLALRPLLLGLYTEQVAGFYEPDSTALFVMDDQPEEALEALLVHELVHAIQDQTVDLDQLTDSDLGADRSMAAQAAIEGHATLVMLEHMTAQVTGAPVDFGQIPDFGRQVRPALEGMIAQYPELSRAPRIIRETLLFPYIEGAAFVQSLWMDGERVPPFGDALPVSTEQVMRRGDGAAPIELELMVEGATILHDDVLGRFELGILIEDVVGDVDGGLADSWNGDRYAVVEQADGIRALVSFIVWDSPQARDRFVQAVGRAPSNFGGTVQIEALQIAGHAATRMSVNSTDDFSASAAEVGGR